jgi:hypothetical protein
MVATKATAAIALGVIASLFAEPGVGFGLTIEERMLASPGAIALLASPPLSVNSLLKLATKASDSIEMNPSLTALAEITEYILKCLVLGHIAVIHLSLGL